MISDETLQILIFAWSLPFAAFALLGVIWLARYWQRAVRRELFREYVYPVASSEDSELLRHSFRQLIAALVSPHASADTLEPISRILAKYAIDKKEMIRIVVQESRSLERREILEGESMLNMLSPSLQSDESVGRLMSELKISLNTINVPFLSYYIFRSMAKATRLYLGEIQMVIVSSLRAHF